MEYDYISKKLRKQLSSSSEIKKSFGERAKLICQRLDEVDSSPNLAILMSLPGPDCHRLSGQRKNHWSLRISGNYRIIFEILDDPIPMKSETEIDYTKVTRILIVEIIDYH